MDIISLQPRIRRVAYSLAAEYNWAETPDEWQQVMNLAILERAATDRNFMLQQPAYLITHAAYRARDHYRSTFSAKKLGLNNVAASLDAENPDGTDLAETLADDELDAEMTIAVRDAIATLTGRARKVAELLLAGMQRKDIAASFGIRSQSLSEDLAKVRAALTPVYASLSL
jgi:RNA polymerase sigma factor (sigma-70 family)